MRPLAETLLSVALFPLMLTAALLAIWRNPPGLSEHDRFADRAIYSEDPTDDPLA